MDAPPILQRHPALRWLAPVGVAGLAAAIAAGVLDSGGGASEAALPATSPAALIAAVQTSEVTGFAGTVSSHLSLGLPALPDVGNVGDGASFTSLLAGTHTLQVWYGGRSRQRIALLGSTDETDVFRDGRSVWQWSSADRTAVHELLPAESSSDASTAAGAIARATPLAVAQAALNAMEPSTKVTVERGTPVADRATYELVLAPRSSATKVGEVRISIDGATKIPLAVQVLARGASSPSVDVSFTRVEFGGQPARAFRFTPPPDAKIRTVSHSPGRGDVAHRSAVPAVRRTGSGWATVVDVRGSAGVLKSLRRRAVLSALTPVRGTWGSGWLLDSDLVSALVTTKGRVLVGAVPPEALYAAAGRK